MCFLIPKLRRRRLKLLLDREINLYAYHLPLDAHPEFGNNAQLARRFGWQITGRFAEQEIGFLGVLPAPELAGIVAKDVGAALGRQPSEVVGHADGEGDKRDVGSGSRDPRLANRQDKIFQRRHIAGLAV